MAAAFVGKWKLSESENFDEFLKALGVGLAWRKLGQTSKPTVEIKVEGDDWSIKTHTILKTSELKFTLGKEFDEDRMDGSKVKSKVTLEDGKLVQKQSGDKEVTIVREVKDNQLHVVCSIDDVVSTRKYLKE
ncbi:sodium/calcium exchanger regulatory protein 1 [Rhipicephalus sanguineus]|uniref:sodium/calcium exchanger regulatory protein 1 n=1 Tax=Rhipicephalus sanguineus TaxID=34632 RepID=UPI0018962CB3|nr:sodium/calcium exchanger regulatory protein 1 [Rhipicephalus sanguineus]